MKKMFKSIGAAVLVLAAGICVTQAQTTNNTAPTFFQSSYAWLTSFNTNYSFAGVKLEADTGYKQTTGANAANYVDVRYNLNDIWGVKGSFQFSGVGSAFNAEEVGPAMTLISHYDTQVSASLLGGYDGIFKSGVIEPELTLRKKLTPNTYAEIGISLPERFNDGFNSTPSFKSGFGFTY